MAPELFLVNPAAPPPKNPIEAIFFWILLTPIAFVLQWLTNEFAAFGPTRAIGAFGLGIIVLTLAIRGALFPLFRWQITTQWKIQNQQRFLSPEIKEIQAKYKKDKQRQQQEMMALYRRHGVNPLSQLSGCLPLLIQLPFIYALFGSINKLSSGLHGHTSFLWISKLNETAFKAPHGGILGNPTLLIVPILAGVLTYMQSKMMMQPARPDMTDQERQMYRVMSQTTYLMPVLIAFFALNFQQGVGLYWITQSLVMVIQVYTMMGWGGLKVPAWVPGAGWIPANSPRAQLAALEAGSGPNPLRRSRGGAEPDSSGNGSGRRPSPQGGQPANGRPLPSGGQARQNPAGGSRRNRRRTRSR